MATQHWDDPARIAARNGALAEHDRRSGRGALGRRARFADEEASLQRSEVLVTPTNFIADPAQRRSYVETSAMRADARAEIMRCHNEINAERKRQADLAREIGRENSSLGRTRRPTAKRLDDLQTLEENRASRLGEPVAGVRFKPVLIPSRQRLDRC